MIGRRFGMLKVIEGERIVNQRREILCQCDCGKKTWARKSELQRKDNHGKKSCCQRGMNNFSHGMRRNKGETPRFYRIWSNMKTRTTCKTHKSWKYYGGRGITVCKRWCIFKLFMKDMYESYQRHVEEFGEKNTQIDRINNDKGYSPNNCRWSTVIEQARNQRRHTQSK